MMDKYIAELESHMVAVVFVNLLLLAFLALLFLVFSKVKILKRFKAKFLILVLMAAVTILTAFEIIPMIIDVNQQSILTVENVKYLREYSSLYRSGLNNHRIIITFPEGYSIKLKFIEGGEEKTPYGEYTGTVIYAKNSKQMLYFFFDD